MTDDMLAAWDREGLPPEERRRRLDNMKRVFAEIEAERAAPKPATETPAEARLSKLFDEHLAQFPPEEQERMVNTALAVPVKVRQPDADLLALVRAARKTLAAAEELHGQGIGCPDCPEEVGKNGQDCPMLVAAEAALAPYAHLGTEKR